MRLEEGPRTARSDTVGVGRDQHLAGQRLAVNLRGTEARGELSHLTQGNHPGLSVRIGERRSDGQTGKVGDRASARRGQPHPDVIIFVVGCAPGGGRFARDERTEGLRQAGDAQPQVGSERAVDLHRDGRLGGLGTAVDFDDRFAAKLGVDGPHRFLNLLADSFQLADVLSLNADLDGLA